MTNDQTPLVRPENVHIDLEQAHELPGWCQALMCTEDQLREAVSTVGGKVISVYLHLQLNKISPLHALPRPEQPN
ncbi:DUF3606 domain-containing protein [Hymenobacter sp. BT683]|uniref:DUF3606 domain-containing protein n=1 Tax=Hymenobacter jeongseonensis TaxID=2791027 RepID=A0ABS0IMA1_9BACT|nr:DUF3606 domain-containing protein [Hymenobacter jeongseonensis]MBF9239497.1 DUF3606 domain-containing protein [Hymenobacter jeongseonensis]